MRIFVLLYVFSLGLFALPHGIDELIRQSGISKNDLSIYIKESGRHGKVIASLNANTTRTPASVVKVLTTYAAVLRLGFDYRWKTKFYTSGTLKHGVLYGNLFIKGYGDPTLNSKDLSSIVASLKRKGIRKIEGNIVIDRTYFKVGNKDSSRFDENPYSAYNAMPDAMMFNERVSTVCVTPKQESVYKKDYDESYQVIDRLQYVNQSCKGKYSWPRVKIEESSHRPKVILKGMISKHCGKRNICKVLTKPYKSFYYALKEKMKEEGIHVSGTLKLQKIPKYAHRIFTHYSDNLEKIVAKTAKKSNNLYARHLLLLLGAKMYGAPATLKKGRKAIKSILLSHGVVMNGQLRLDNGSGLSRVAKMNAKILASVFDHAYIKYGSRWLETLSIAGVDGTIKRRFRNTVVSQRAWMKTGTLKRVKNIGGYVKNKQGTYYTTVILVNSSKARYRGAKLQNNIMKWLVKKKLTRSSRSINPKRVTKKISTTYDIHSKEKTDKQYFYIQTGSYQINPSRQYLGKISQLGLPYKVEKTDIYKVLIGPYKKEETARRVLSKVKAKLNRSAFVLKQ